MLWNIFFNSAELWRVVTLSSACSCFTERVEEVCQFLFDKIHTPHTKVFHKQIRCDQKVPSPGSCNDRREKAANEGR